MDGNKAASLRKRAHRAERGLGRGSKARQRCGTAGWQDGIHTTQRYLQRPTDLRV